MQGMFAGWHLAYDAIVHREHAGKLNNIDFLKQALLDLAELLDMDVFDGPRLRKVELDPGKIETQEDEGGVTGTVVISTSHISIHTWPLRERFSLDVFSCVEYDERRVQEFLWTRMNVKRRSSHWIKRQWP